MKIEEEVYIKKACQIATKIVTAVHKVDKSGRLLFLICKKICAISKLAAYNVCIKTNGSSL